MQHYLEYALRRPLTIAQGMDIYRRVVRTGSALTHKYYFIAENNEKGVQFVTDTRMKGFLLRPSPSSDARMLSGKDQLQRCGEYDTSNTQRRERWEAEYLLHQVREGGGELQVDRLLAYRRPRVYGEQLEVCVESAGGERTLRVWASRQTLLAISRTLTEILTLEEGADEEMP